ncbi:MAG: hypothetical protein HYV78_01220 [Candidatus Wildermuthbacteria bacterium]|nr:hypothetical protein [Candidatus Wildermuthbacteria bacterium]
MKSWSFVHIAGVAGVFVLGTFIGFAGGTQIVQNKAMPEQDLPVASSLLSSPVLYEWWASAKGTLTEKGDGYIILEQEGKQTRVELMNDALQSTSFARQLENAQGSFQSIQLKDIPLGSQLRGTVIVSGKGPQSRQSEQASHVLGVNFTLINEKIK